jgi:hypothetical protein
MVRAIALHAVEETMSYTIDIATGDKVVRGENRLAVPLVAHNFDSIVAMLNRKLRD